MNTPRPEEQPSIESTPAAPVIVSDVYASVRALLDPASELDSADKMIVGRVLSFLAAPTDRWEDIKSHASSVGEVIAGYQMLGKNAPAEVEELNRVMQSLQCECAIVDLKKAIAATNRDPEAIGRSMIFVTGLAETYKRGYRDERYVLQVTALRSQAESL